MLKTKFLATPIISFSLLTGFAQELRIRNLPKDQHDMHERVMDLYNFHPVQVSDSERQAKSKDMDIFWNEAKAYPSEFLPLLRTELLNTLDPPFFFMDGSDLLITLSKEHSDEEIAASALSRVDLSDVQPTAYFRAVHQLAVENADTTAAAFHILDRPIFIVSVPMHAMTLDRRIALMYVLLSMKNDNWVEAAKQRFFSDKASDTKLALLFALFYEQTDHADAVIRDAANDPSQPAEVHNKAEEFVRDLPAPAKVGSLENSSITDLRAKRRERLRAVSDEAMDDVQSMTGRLVKMRRKAAK